jgi:hypothetical protein
MMRSLFVAVLLALAVVGSSAVRPRQPAPLWESKSVTKGEFTTTAMADYPYVVQLHVSKSHFMFAPLRHVS